MRRAVILVALLASPIVLAADTKGQADAMKVMTDAFSKMEDDLAGADRSDGGARLLRVVKTHIPAVKKGLDAYEKAADGDSTAERNHASWEKLLDQLEDSAGTLVQMRGLMNLQDEAPAKCKAAWTALEKKLETLAKDSSLDAKQKLKSLKVEVDKIAIPVAKGIEDFDKKLDQIKDLGDDASRPSTSDKLFSHIFSEVDSAADAIAGHYVNANKDMHEACDRLAKGMSNPDVNDIVTAIERAGKAAGDAAKEAREDFARWIGRVQDLGQWHEASEDELRRAICGADDRDGVILDAAINDVADRLMSRLKSEWSKLNKDATLLHKKLTAAGLDKEAEDLENRVRRVEGVILDGMLRGANHPKLRAQLEIGKKEHVAYQRSCDAKEVVLSSSDRVDCVNFGDPCEVIEVKPNTPSGADAGEAQIKRYEKTLESTWSSDPKKFDSGDLEIFKDRCVEKGKLNIKYRVHLYKFCPDKWDIADVRAFQ